MATTLEYIIILTGIITYKGIPIHRIDINRGYFILFDKDGNELYNKTRMPGGTTNIVSGFIPYLSFGERFRLVVGPNQLYAVSDEDGQKEIESEVTVPEE